MKKYTLVLIVLSSFAFDAIGQELNCTVSLSNTGQVKNRTEEIYNNMRTAIEDFMNSTVWTADKFGAIEKIDCSIAINVTEETGTNSYTAEAVIQSSRPVFNSSYSTTIFYMKDADFSFSYADGEPLIFNEGAYTSKITSMLAFYAYLILGMDYDSYSLKGGTKYFNEAQQIVMLAQSSSSPGWKSKEAGKRNRFWLVDNVLHQLFEPLRDCFYQYHRKGIDVLFENKETGRQAIYNAINLLSTVIRNRPNSINTQSFVQAKSNELKNLSIDADKNSKTKIVNLLKRIDPANSSKYQEILN